MRLHLITGELSNKGQELMLHAVRQHFADQGAEHVYSSDTWFGPYETRARLGLRQLLWPPSLRLSGSLGHLVLSRYGKAFGIVTERDVDAVVDFAGFAYTDLWGGRATSVAAERIRRWRRQGKPVVLLPQALGPYTRSSSREAVKRIIEAATLVFARDETSYRHVVEIAGEPENLRIAPDFTNLVNGRPQATFGPSRRFACIVPNLRMLTQTSERVREAYVPFLRTALEELLRRDIEPVVVIHEVRNDVPLLDPLLAGMPTDRVEVVVEPDPVAVKGILGAARLVIGSRYHALISALSQATPAIGTSWSHKYEALYREYDVAELLLKVEPEGARLAAQIDRLDDDRERRDLVERLAASAAHLKERSAAMWVEVDEALSHA